jgi:hypothetical protein
MLRAGDNDLIEEPLVTATGCSMTDAVGEFRDISRHYCGTGGGDTDEGDAADSGGNGRHFLPEPSIAANGEFAAPYRRRRRGSYGGRFYDRHLTQRRGIDAQTCSSGL